MAGRRKSPDAADHALWHRVAREVTPLKGRERRRRGEGAMAETRDEPVPARKAPARPVARSVAPTPAAPELAAGAAPGLDRRTADRLRRGRLAVEARIDLHGLTRDAAQAALARFLNAAQGRGLRCVLVITGKGLGGEGAGVIRAALPGWLNDAALRPLIVAFSQAQPRDGGAGAFYVYLRRDRTR